MDSLPRHAKVLRDRGNWHALRNHLYGCFQALTVVCGPLPFVALGLPLAASMPALWASLVASACASAVAAMNAIIASRTACPVRHP